MSSNEARGGDLPLRGHAERAFEDYLINLGGTRSPGLYQRVIREVEEPLLRVVLRHAEGNQTRAA